MKAVISGANGFISYHLAAALSAKELSVVPIARELLFSPSELRSFFLREKPQFIYHLAAYGNHANQKDAARIILSNVLGTFNMLEASKDLDYIAFVNVGSSSEYGNKLKPMKEGDLPEADTFYGASKVGATYIARAFSKQYNKPIFTTRLFSVYGPNEADFRFIPTIIKNSLDDTEMIVSPGVHDWIYVNDVINALLVCADNGTKLKGGVVNIGNGKQYSNMEVVELMGQVARKRIKVKYQMDLLRPYDTISWVADNSLLRSLDWRSQFDLEEGLTQTYEWYKKQRP